MRPFRSTLRPSRASAFTLVEMLVVIGIIAVLIGLVVVVSARAFKTADKTRLGFQIQTIEQALEAYKTDFNSYPIYTPTSFATAPTDVRNENGYRGARLLCKALIAPTPGYSTAPLGVNQDGANGPGFRVLPRSGVPKYDATPPTEMVGKKYGPYLNESALKVSKTFSTLAPGGTAGNLNESDPGTYDDSSVILDASGKPVLYYPVLNPQPPFTTPDAFVGRGTNEATPAATYAGLPMYRASDNDGWLLPTVFRKQLGMGPNKAYGTGSFDPATPGADLAGNQTLDATETAAVKGKYILWLAGPDGIFGPNLTGPKPDEVDDVTNVP